VTELDPSHPSALSVEVDAGELHPPKKRPAAVTCDALGRAREIGVAEGAVPGRGALAGGVPRLALKGNTVPA